MGSVALDGGLVSFDEGVVIPCLPLLGLLLHYHSTSKRVHKEFSSGGDSTMDQCQARANARLSAAMGELWRRVALLGLGLRRMMPN